MQILNLTGTFAGTQPVYLPYDKAPVPFGDPLGATYTAGTPAIFYAVGYNPTLGDAVSINPTTVLTTANGVTGIIQPGQAYYVAGIAATGSFTLSTSNSTLSSLSLWAGTAATAHLLSQQVDGTTLPFKPGNTVVAINGGASMGTGVASAAITLFGASDKQTGYGDPQGPNTFAVIATIAFGVPKIIQLNYDWIVASAATGTLNLIQN